MKKILLLIPLLILFISGCSDNNSNDSEKNSETELSAVQIAENVVKASGTSGKLSNITFNDEDFTLWLTNFYNIPEEFVTDGAVYYAEGAQSDEIAVFKLSNESNIESVKSALSEYKDSRITAFEGYAPTEAAKVENGVVAANGNFAALFICSDTTSAESAFYECFGDHHIVISEISSSENFSDTQVSQPQIESSTEPISSSEIYSASFQSTQSSSSSSTSVSSSQNALSSNSSIASVSSSQKPQSSSVTVSSSEKPQSSSSSSVNSSSSKPTENIKPITGYDRNSVLNAWQTGNESALSDLNKQILKAAENVISEEIKNGMSSYEKELAIHDWITHNCRFDYGVFDRGSAGYANNSDNPYGVLINGSAMCHGYSSTFQLFMDMLGIECITVFGNPSSGTQHSWNMVKLDEEWYCVDAAWDDPIGGSPCHTYFNVTSDYLRSRGIHRWDESAVPEATATKYAYH